jgi:cytochrome c-type biogenesis protein CcmH
MIAVARPWTGVMVAIFVGIVTASSAQVVTEIIDPPLEDPILEARAQTIHKQIRCLVCQNQSIHDSNAGLARDLRIIVRDRVTAGDTNDQAIQFLVDRYGDWILLKPPFKATTIALWLGPILILMLAGWSAWAYFRAASTQVAKAVPLTEEEQRRLAKLLDIEV